MVEEEANLTTGDFDADYDALMGKLEELRESLSEAQKGILDYVVSEHMRHHDDDEDESRRWIRIGSVPIDSATLVLVDPCRKQVEIPWMGNDAGPYAAVTDQDGECGVVVRTGWGDFCYPVYAEIWTDPDNPKHRRIFSVRVDFD